MNNKLTILVVEDNPFECKNLSTCINNTNDMKLLAVTNNAQKALEYILDYSPTVIILDLELHQGSGTGLDVLAQMKTLKLSIKPYILITTNNTSSTIHEFVRNNGADFIMTKYQEDYSAENVIKFLQMLKSIILSKCSQNQFEVLIFQQPPEIKHQHLSKRIHAYLDLIGINPKVLGYSYLTDAIELFATSRPEHLCVQIAKKNGKTTFSVERAMQNAINKAWSTTDIETLERNYTAKIRLDKGAPTLMEFISYYATKIRDNDLDHKNRFSD